MTTTPAPTDLDLDAIEAYLCRPSHSVDRLHGHATQLLDALATERRQGASMASFADGAIRQIGEERDAAREDLAKTLAELERAHAAADMWMRQLEELTQAAGNYQKRTEDELAKTRAELAKAQQMEVMAGRHAQQRDADLKDAEVTIQRLKTRLAEGDARWSRHMADEHPIEAEANPATTAEPADEPKADHDECDGTDHPGMTCDQYDTALEPTPPGQLVLAPLTDEPADEPKAELCTDKNGFHDGHDWTPDPCEPYRWCPGYPVPAAG